MAEPVVLPVERVAVQEVLAQRMVVADSEAQALRRAVVVEAVQRSAISTMVVVVVLVLVVVSCSRMM